MKYLQKYRLFESTYTNIVYDIKDILTELDDLGYITEVDCDEVERDHRYGNKVIELIIVIKKSEPANIARFCETDEEFYSMTEVTKRIQDYLFSSGDWKQHTNIGPDKGNELTITYIDEI